MRYKTFRMVALGAAVAAAGGGAYYAFESRAGKGSARPAASAPAPASTPAPAPRAPAPVAPVAPAPAPAPVAAPAPVTPATAAPGGQVPLRELDRDVLTLARGARTNVKDGLPGRPYKVNLFVDAGSSTVNRLKLDLDRDGKWDEKWSFEADGRVKRQVAPADDENYTDSYVLDGNAWRRKKE
jgi:hypothetical protein